MKILITGGNGYIAKSLSNGLWEGVGRNNISILTRKELDLTDRDATNKWFEGTYFDVIIHTAIKGGSRLGKDDGDICYQNIQMFYNLLNNKHCFGKFINFGSGAELGMPTDPYGLSKNIISKIITIEPNFYNIRIYGVFDENELDTRFIKSNIKRYINKEPIQIHQNKIMDFFYMEDLVTLIKFYIYEDDLPKIIDCTYNESMSLSNISHIINNLSDHKVKINIGKYNGSNYTGTPLLFNIKWIGLEQGINKTYKTLHQNEILQKGNNK